MDDGSMDGPLTFVPRQNDGGFLGGGGADDIIIQTRRVELLISRPFIQAAVMEEEPRWKCVEMSEER